MLASQRADGAILFGLGALPILGLARLLSLKWHKLAAHRAQWHIEESTITASDPDSIEDKKLAGFDKLLSFTMPTLYRIDTLLDAQIVKNGLYHLLKTYPDLGARICAQPSGDVLTYDCANGNGFTFQVWSCRGPSPHRLPKSGDVYWPVRKYPWAFESSDHNDDVPLMEARLVLYPDEGVSFVCFSVSHVLADGQNYVDIARVWSQGCVQKDSDLPSLPRDWARGQKRNSIDYVEPSDHVNIVTSLDEYIKTMGEKLGAPLYIDDSPFTSRFMARRMCNKFLEKLGIKYARSKINVVVKEQALKAYRARIVSVHDHPQKVSTYCALMGAVICTLEHARQKASGFRWVKVVINMRGRLRANDDDDDLLPVSYFGNGSREMFVQFNVVLDSPRQTSINLHLAIQKMIKNKDYLVQLATCGKALVDLKFPFSRGILSIRGTRALDAYTLNSWTKYQWLNIDFGSRVKPNAISNNINLPECHNLVLVTPLASGHLFGVMINCPEEQQRFEAYAAKHNIPFEIQTQA